jgi:hypothetical protein
MRLVPAWFVAWVVAGIACIASLTIPPSRLPSDRLGLRRIQVPLEPNMTVSQTFLMTADGLHAVEIVPARVDADVAGRIVLQLHEQGSDVVRSAEVSGAEFTSAPSYRFEFEPIDDSRDATYRLDVLSSDSSPARGIALWATKGDRAEGTMLINGRERWADLAFRTFAPAGRSGWQRLTGVAGANPDARGAIVLGFLAAYWIVLGLVLRVSWTFRDDVAVPQ